MISHSENSLARYIRFLENDVPFALSRYGDGEFAAMFGMSGHNCDGHEYFPEMGRELRRTMRETIGEGYEYGIVRIAYKVFGENRILDWIDKNHSGDIGIYDGTVMVDASRDGKLFPLIDCLRDKKILYVGPEHLRYDLPSIFPTEHFIAIPDQNCYDVIDLIEEEITEACTLFNYDLIGFSAGPSSEILMWRLYTKMLPRITMIDFGSLWDGFVGVPSRKYHKTDEWQALKTKNLTGSR